MTDKQTDRQTDRERGFVDKESIDVLAKLFNIIKT